MSKKTGFDPEAWTKRLQEAHSDPQSCLFGQIRDKRKEMEQINREILHVQKELRRQSKILFHDRPAVPLTPFVMLPRAILIADDLTAFDVRLFALIFHHSHDKKTAWPSETTLARQLSCSVRTIQRSLVRLVRKGYLLIGTRLVARNCFVNHYTLNLEDPRERSK